MKEHQSRQVQAAAKSTNHPLDQSGITVDYQFQTRLGVAVKEVLGDKEDVRKLDKKHHDLKHLKSKNIFNRQALESYKATLAEIQVKILAESSVVYFSLANKTSTKVSQPLLWSSTV